AWHSSFTTCSSRTRRFSPCRTTSPNLPAKRAHRAALEHTVKSTMHEIGAVRALIASGKHLLLAGDEHLLASLPKGSWIGGTIPYFMTEEGGTHSKDRIFVTEMPAEVAKVEIRNYDERTIS